MGVGEELDKRNICIIVQQEVEEKEIQELSDNFTEEQIINAVLKLINKNVQFAGEKRGWV
jgi:hypothetical protein